MPPTRPATVDDLAQLRTAIRDDLHEEFRGAEQHADAQFGSVRADLTQITAKLDAIMETVAVRQELRRLVDQLQERGIEIDEHRIFADLTPRVR